MSIEINLPGQYLLSKNIGNSLEWLKAVKDWFQAAAGDTLTRVYQVEESDGSASLYLKLHPGAECVRLSLLEPGQFIVSGRTSSAGPGYHIYLCDLLKDFGNRFDVRWARPQSEGHLDESGYFFSHDKAAVYNSMHNWLRQIADFVLEREGQLTELSVAMSADHLYRRDGITMTQLGPRDFRYWRRVALDPRSGRDFFPWYEEGQGASYLLGRALCHMWTDVRWRRPIDEGEQQLMDYLVTVLGVAYELDRSLNYPFREWAELLQLCGRGQEKLHQEVERCFDGSEEPLVGYRRGDVTVVLPDGWEITIPGSLAEKWEDDGVFCAWDSERTVRLSRFSFSDNSGCLPTAEDVLAACTQGKTLDLAHASGPVVGRATFNLVVEPDGKYWCLSGFSASPGSLAFATVCVEDKKDYDFALRVWHSLTRRGGA